MTSNLSRLQFWAFLALVGAIVLVSLAPIIVTGIMGKVVPDSLVAVSDKCLTGLVGVLGTIAGVAWRSTKNEQETRL